MALSNRVGQPRKCQRPNATKLRKEKPTPIQRRTLPAGSSFPLGVVAMPPKMKRLSPRKPNAKHTPYGPKPFRVLSPASILPGLIIVGIRIGSLVRDQETGRAHQED